MKKIRLTITTSLIFFLFTFSSFGEAFKVVSWNMWVLSQKIETDTSKAKRKAAIEKALDNLKYDILIAQEILDQKGADFVSNSIIPKQDVWSRVLCTGRGSQSQGNAIWFRRDKFEELSHKCISAGFQHPVALGVLKDKKEDKLFIVISVHFTYANGKTEKSKEELLRLLDLAGKENKKTFYIFIGGDTNMPTESGNSLSARNFSVTIDSGVDQYNKQSPKPVLQFKSIMDQPTSRSPKKSGGKPRNNYDHFILTTQMNDICTGEVLEQDTIEEAEKDAQGNWDKDAYTSDHFPISISCNFSRAASSPAAASDSPAASQTAPRSSQQIGQSTSGTKRERPDETTQEEEPPLKKAKTGGK